MGYDLKPKNKKLESLAVGAFTWPIFLQETGMGYVLGYGAGMKSGSYVYQNGNNGSPVSNDGYKVSSSQAKMMAAVARGYVSVQRFVNKEWEALSEEDLKYWEASHYCRKKMHEDHLKFLEKFADWAEQSRGFTIN